MRVGLYAGNTMLASPQEQVWGRALGREHLDVMLRDAAVDAGAVFQAHPLFEKTRAHVAGDHTLSGIEHRLDARLR